MIIDNLNQSSVHIYIGLINTVDEFFKASKMNDSEKATWFKYIQENDTTKIQNKCEVCIQLKAQLKVVRNKKTAYDRQKRRTKQNEVENDEEARLKNAREKDRIEDEYDTHIRSEHNRKRFKIINI